MAPQWGVRRLRGHPVAHRGQDRVTADDARDVDTQFGQRHRRQMVMRIDEARQAHPAIEVNDFGCAIGEVISAVAGADMNQVGTAHHHRLRPRSSGIAGPDRTAAQKIGVHHAATVAL